MRCAVIGHVEWVEFARVPQHAGGRLDRSCRRDVVGAGRRRRRGRAPARAARRPVRASSRRSASDELGRAAERRLAELGIDVHVQWGGQTRRAWIHVDGDGERTITVLGDKLLPHGPLPLDGYDLVFFVSGTAEVLRGRARRGSWRRRSRELPTLHEAGVPLDLLVGSVNDPGERYDGLARGRDRGADRRRERRHGERRALRRGAGRARSSTPTAPATRSPRRSRSRLRAGTRSPEALELAARAGSAVLGGRGPVRGAASVGRDDRTRRLDLAHAGEGDRRAPRRRDRAARDRSRTVTGASTSSTRRGRLVNNKDYGPLQLVRAEYDEARRRADAAPARRRDRQRPGRAWGGARDELPLAGPQPARLVRGPWDDALSSLVGEPVRLVEPERRGRRSRPWRRSDPARRRRRSRRSRPSSASHEVDGRRFRMNFGVDGLEPHAEDGWLGRRIAIGEAVVVPQGNVGRCVGHDPEPRHRARRSRTP